MGARVAGPAAMVREGRSRLRGQRGETACGRASGKDRQVSVVRYNTVWAEAEAETEETLRERAAWLRTRWTAAAAGQASVVGGRGVGGGRSASLGEYLREDAGSSKRLEGVTAARIAWWVLGAGGRQQQRRSGRSCRGGSGGAGRGRGGGGGGARGGLHASGFRLKGSEANGRLGA
jgi:hypothetical protein